MVFAASSSRFFHHSSQFNQERQPSLTGQNDLTDVRWTRYLGDSHRVEGQRWSLAQYLKCRLLLC